MPFQKTVAAEIAFGIVGELALAGSVRAEPIRLKADAGGNAIGKAITIAAGDIGVGSVGGSGQFVGIAFNPKEGCADTAIGLDYSHKAGDLLDVVSETPGLFIQLTTAGAVGDAVAYAANGTLAAAPAQVAPASHTLIPGSRIVRYDVTTGLAIVALTQLPTPAAP